MERQGAVFKRQTSESEFSYQWQFWHKKDTTSYQSPTFGSTSCERFVYYWQHPIISEELCDDLFHDCYFEAVYDGSNSQEVMRFFLKDFNDFFGSKMAMSVSATVCIQWTIHELKLSKSEEKGDFIKVFEFPLSSTGFYLSDEFVFKLNVKLLGGLSSLNTLSRSEGEVFSIKVNKDSSMPYIDNPKRLIQDLRSIYTSKDEWDFQIHIGGEIIRAHKSILCARSTVFKKMVEHDCLESAFNSVIITDCSAESFKKFLKYLYTGEIEDTKLDTLIPLYILGDKYDVLAITEACSKILRYKLLSESFDHIIEIVCDILQLAERYRDSKLKKIAMNLIAKHFSAISEKQCWKDLIESDTELAAEVLAPMLLTFYRKLQS